MISQHHEPDFADPHMDQGWTSCRRCGGWIDVSLWVMQECPGPRRKEETTMRTLKTAYGPASFVMAGAWPVQVCPICGREHAHPPTVTADYWPMCWDCWKARPTCFQRREED